VSVMGDFKMPRPAHRALLDLDSSILVRGARSAPPGPATSTLDVTGLQLGSGI
jgi:hypothetical protein